MLFANLNARVFAEIVILKRRIEMISLYCDVKESPFQRGTTKIVSHSHKIENVPSPLSLSLSSFDRIYGSAGRSFHY